MLIFVDTCVWRYWLTLSNDLPFETSDPARATQYETYARDFNQIYELISSLPAQHTFLYNARIEGELPDRFLKELPVSFSRVKDEISLRRAPIPHSRYDGTYMHDGSLIRSGNFGGTLLGILSIDGHDHETALRNAQPAIRRRNPAHTPPRLREFDIEHLESALEAGADIFITTDEPLIARLHRAAASPDANPAVIRANEVCCTPRQALERLTTTKAQC